MLGGIAAVGIIVYFGLSALSTTDGPRTTDTTLASSTTAPLTTTTRESTTTSRESTTTTTAITTTTVALRPPSEIVVRVLNAVGVAGLASDVSAGLQELGYQTLEPGNYEPALSQSRVWYAAGFEGEAFELAAEFPDALVEQVSPGDDGEADIVVVLGESYEG